MDLNIRELAMHGTAANLQGTVKKDAAVTGMSGIRLLEPIKADLTAYSDSGTVIVNGTLSANVEFDCSKCLKTVEEQMEYPVTEMFTTDRGTAEMDEDIHLIHEDVIDLDPYLSSAFAVQLPMAAVCDSNCKGLCPVCGKDRNVEDCGCVQEKIDPRLAGLKDFFNKKES